MTFCIVWINNHVVLFCCLDILDESSEGSGSSSGDSSEESEDENEGDELIIYILVISPLLYFFVNT